MVYLGEIISYIGGKILCQHAWYFHYSCHRGIIVCQEEEIHGLIKASFIFSTHLYSPSLLRLASIPISTLCYVPSHGGLCALVSALDEGDYSELQVNVGVHTGNVHIIQE